MLRRKIECKISVINVRTFIFRLAFGDFAERADHVISWRAAVGAARRVTDEQVNVVAVTRLRQRQHVVVVLRTAIYLHSKL